MPVSSTQETEDTTHTPDRESDEEITDGRAEPLPEWEIDGQIWTPRTLLNRMQASKIKIEDLEDKVERKDERIADLEREVKALEDENEELWKRLGELDGRTDMLRVLDESETASAAQMRARILQHMWQMVKGESGDDRVYAMDRDKTEEILHNPDVDRTTINRWMETAAEKVGDENVCYYEGGQPGPSGRGARIVLDLRDQPSLPESVNGVMNNAHGRGGS
ncbi:MAG: hypothetical protein ACOCUO_02160 [archaeon]